MGAKNFVPESKFTRAYLFCKFCELWASPPTPHTNRGSVRPRRLDTAHSATNGRNGAQCHQPLLPIRTYARDFELPRCQMQQ